MGALLSILVFGCGGNSPHPVDVIPLDTLRQIEYKIEADTTDGKVIKFVSPYHFNLFKVATYRGNLAQPDFKNNEFGNDQEFVDFIQEGCDSNGINFGGHYTIVLRSCGAMCEHFFMVDRINGKIISDVRPVFEGYGFLYRKDSNLLIANSNLFPDDSLKEYNDFFGHPELFLWQGNEFRLIQRGNSAIHN